MRGRLITLEGIDGSGKSSHTNTIATQLRSKGLDVVTTREPGGTPVGDDLRRLLLTQNMSPVSEILLALASRHEHQLKVLLPALSRGAWVICDRYTDSTLAYQLAGKLDVDKYLGKEPEEGQPDPNSELVMLLDVLTWSIGDLVYPDLTLLFETPSDVAQRRRAGRGGEADRFESQSEDYFSKVSTAYRVLAKSDQDDFGANRRIHTIDSSRPFEQVTNNVLNVVNEYYERTRPVIAK